MIYQDKLERLEVYVKRELKQINQATTNTENEQGKKEVLEQVYKIMTGGLLEEEL